MPLTLAEGRVREWVVRKIGVIGPGIVGMPMAALLAHARIREGSDVPARVQVVQRDSASSGWKVPAINAGRSPIGGVEPGLEAIVAECAREGLLSATHDVGELADADVVLVCVQTDKSGIGPDYGPLLGALEGLCPALVRRPAGNLPLIVFESTLAPSSMSTVIRETFARHGLVEGRDVLLGNSPNRVMPGRLVERVRSSDKIVAGLSSVTPELIARLYERIVTQATLHRTNSLTAEVVKTLENAYRDVRIAYAAELVRFCDERDVDFFALRDRVNQVLAQVDGASGDPTAVPVGGLLVPTLGVGGHCLPKDGVLLWWRRREAGQPEGRSLILGARRVNDASPGETIKLAERALGPLDGRRVALMGVAYRFDSEDTRNSPSFALTELLRAKGCTVRLHDPHVRPDDPNLKKRGLTGIFSRDLAVALEGAQVLFLCTGHRAYVEACDAIHAAAPGLQGMVDACNLWPGWRGEGLEYPVACLGRGRREPDPELVDFALAGFRAVERATSRVVADLCEFLNDRYAPTPFERVEHATVRRLAATCSTGCEIVAPEPPEPVASYQGFLPELVKLALAGR
jgi:UDP-N-acetyl-D-mannosaminuronic acid dehydrogenase